jgi:hypothetical protein
MARLYEAPNYVCSKCAMFTELIADDVPTHAVVWCVNRACTELGKKYKVLLRQVDTDEVG